MSDEGYVDYFKILHLDEAAKPGEVRKNYKRMMKELVMEIASVQITEERRQHYLLEMAKLNAAFYVLRDNERREAYWEDRKTVIRLEEEWRKAAETNAPDNDARHRRFDARLRDFLSDYVEDLMLAAGRDAECVEASHWDAAHARHASRLLRQYRQSLNQKILERLPYYEVTTPAIDWRERAQTVASILSEGGG